MTETPQKTVKQPTHRAYAHRWAPDPTAKSDWIEIGVVVEIHRDGKGCDIQLDAFPCDGRIVIRPGPPDIAVVAGDQRPFS